MGLAALLMLAAAAAMALRGASSPADQPMAVEEPPAPFRPMVVVNPGVPFVTFTDLSLPVFDRHPVSTEFALPVEVWSNLPR